MRQYCTSLCKKGLKQLMKLIKLTNLRGAISLSPLEVQDGSTRKDGPFNKLVLMFNRVKLVSGLQIQVIFDNVVILQPRNVVLTLSS